MGSKLRGLGTSVFTGTRELLEQVTDAISSELDSIEGMAARNRPGAANRSATRWHPWLLLGFRVYILYLSIYVVCYVNPKVDI